MTCQYSSAHPISQLYEDKYTNDVDNVRDNVTVWQCGHCRRAVAHLHFVIINRQYDLTAGHTLLLAKPEP